MKALIIYDLTGTIWNIVYGEGVAPQGLPCMYVDMPDGAQIERVDITDPEHPKAIFSYLPETDIDRLKKQVAQLSESDGDNILILADAIGGAVNE